MLPLALAILPGILISIYIYYKDIHEKEPHRFLIACFVFGMLSTIPAIFLEEFGQGLGFTDTANVLIFAFVVVAGSEELVKFLFLRYYIYPKDEFNEPMDGIVYAVMIGMGFATLENILYVTSYGIETAMVRMFTAVPAHAAFAVIMGYYVGLAKFEQRKSEEKKLLFIGFIGAVALHGAYDYFLFQQIYEGLAVLAFVSLIGGIYYGRDLIKRHQDDSPFKEDNQTDDLEKTNYAEHITEE
jgi:RsiW-degrading membrane proteinase PrsW (M82 family)